jgi:hypothetical protein
MPIHTIFGAQSFRVVAKIPFEANSLLNSNMKFNCSNTEMGGTNFCHLRAKTLKDKTIVSLVRPL